MSGVYFCGVYAEYAFKIGKNMQIGIVGRVVFVSGRERKTGDRKGKEEGRAKRGRSRLLFREGLEYNKRKKESGMAKRLFEIVTDGSCDMTEEYLERNGVDCIQLGFTMNGVNYGGEDGEKMEAKAFYDALREGAMPTTSQVTSEAAKSCMEKHLKRGEDVLAIAFSSGLSGTAGSFVVAQRELKEKYPARKIEVVDSLCASMGQGLLLDYAVKKADEGASLEETRAYVEDLKLHICHNFTVENLFHLKRGGRISATLAIVGTILKIKPVMHMNDEGKLVSVGKAMGRKKSLQAIVDNMAKTEILQEGDPIFISHGDCMEDAEYLKGLLEQRFPGHEIVIGYVGAVIGSHSGVGTISVFYRGDHR